MERESEPQLQLQPTAEKRERAADSMPESQPKRRKLETGALYGVIPKVCMWDFTIQKRQTYPCCSLMYIPRLSVFRSRLLKENHIIKQNPF